jgi:hypothetical protein
MARPLQLQIVERARALKIKSIGVATTSHWMRTALAFSREAQ